MAGVLQNTNGLFPDMHPLVTRHWIEETGYSFPSGHAFASMATAMALLLMSLGINRRIHNGIAVSLTMWVLIVCYSRMFLGVHTPVDVIVGVMEGMVGGIACFLMFHAICRRMVST